VLRQRLTAAFVVLALGLAFWPRPASAASFGQFELKLNYLAGHVELVVQQPEQRRLELAVLGWGPALDERLGMGNPPQVRYGRRIIGERLFSRYRRDLRPRHDLER